MRIKRLIAVLTATAALAAVFAAPASAQTTQEGLVNVAVEDVIVQVPVAVAANVCDVNVAVLAEVADDAAACEATAESTATAGPRSGGPVNQSGLVNVLIQDVLVQVPVSIAANICDVNVAVLAQLNDQAEACDATAAAAAQPGSGPGGGNGAGGNNGVFIPIDIDLNALTFGPNNDPLTLLDGGPDATADDGGQGNIIDPGGLIAGLPVLQ
jgi:hypothetical protein